MSQIKAILKSGAFELFVLSLTALFYELLAIRWLGCGFASFMVFKNFPLASCFVGLGVGIARGNDRWFRYAPYALLAMLIVTTLLTESGFGAHRFPSFAVFQWSKSDGTVDLAILLDILGSAMAILLLLAGPFVLMLCLGSRIGALFNQQKPLTGYCIDIGGAILGSVLFAISTFLYQNPFSQMLLVAVPLTLYAVKQIDFRVRAVASVIVLAAALTLAGNTSHVQEGLLWTPYQMVQSLAFTVPKEDVTTVEPEPTRLNVTVNHSFYQMYSPKNDISLSPTGEKVPYLQFLRHILSLRKSYFALPYQIHPNPKDVLILGAGTGSDVLEAYKHDVGSIDAVEIDPGILELGKKYNKTLAEKRVRLELGDGRNFVNNVHKKYDLIIFGALDSLGLVGTGTQMRTDSYIHTMQSYRRCLSLLKPDGLLIVTFSAFRSNNSQWMVTKMFQTIKEAASYTPLVLDDEDAAGGLSAAYVFVAGEPVREGKIIPPTGQDFVPATAINVNAPTRIVTDDWPYLYIRPMFVDWTYLFVVSLICMIATIAGRSLLFAKDNKPHDWQLFLLGAAFMLLELQSISRLSLLYGNTWLTASVVINGVLLMILAGNLVIIKFAPKRQDLLYGILFASLLTSYFLPVQQMLQWNGENGFLGHAAVTFFTLFPMFAAGLVFATTYSGVKNPARSFGFNLLGAVAGALIEYVSVYTGLNSLVLLALALYGLSFFCYRLGTSEKTVVDVAVA